MAFTTPKKQIFQLHKTQQTHQPLKEIFHGGMRILITPDTMISDMLKFYDDWENVVGITLMRNFSHINLDEKKSLYSQVENNDRVFSIEYERYFYGDQAEGSYVYVKKDEFTLLSCFVRGELSVKEFFRFVLNKTLPDSLPFNEIFWSDKKSLTIDLNKITCRYVAKLDKVLLV